MKIDMRSGLVYILLIFLNISSVSAQEKPFFENGEFVFFINGANVTIPTLDGTVVDDPLNEGSENKVFRIAYSDWAESGFRWMNGDRDSTGVDASLAIGDEYGESDTLYIRLLSDPANLNGIGNIHLAFLDTNTGTEYDNDDLSFRARWLIPSEMHDGQWHELAIPLPPATYDALENAKSGLDSNGNPLGISVDPTLNNWDYGGAWANPGPSGSEGLIVSPDDPGYQEFDWESVKYFGIHFDFEQSENGAGGPIYFDYFSIGVPPEDISDAPSDPVSNLQLTSSNGINTISWDLVGNASAYTVYFSEFPITDLSSDNVGTIGKTLFEEETVLDHEIYAPHASLAESFTGYYAVTSSSFFGTESELVTSSISSDIKVTENYAAEVSSDDFTLIVDAVNTYYPTEFEIDLSGSEISSFFPDGYVPFEINEQRKIIENGTGGDNDEDISGKLWLGFNSEFEVLIAYSEITDDVITTTPIADGGLLGWANDSWELGIGNYSPESFVISSTHQTYERGENPDYQFRAGIYGENQSSYIYVTHGDSELPGSVTISQLTATGYRMLTVIDTQYLVQLSGNESDTPFDFPSAGEVKTYPFNWALNDNDGSGRETQISWSNLAGGDNWWNNPSRMQTIAFVGTEESDSQYPNPPYALGDTVNFNGNFGTFPVADNVTGENGWYFSTTNPSSQYNIITDSQDGDGKAVEVLIGSYDNTGNDWHTEIVNDPIYVAEGDYYETLVWLRADTDGRLASLYVGLPEVGEWARVAQSTVSLTTEWVEYKLGYFATQFDEENFIRAGVAMNYLENDGGIIYADNFQVRKSEYASPALSTIEVARSIPPGNEVTIKGIVTRTTYNFVYLQEDNAGLMVFSNPTSSVGFFNALQNGEISEGDSLLITGLREEYQGLSEITTITQFEVTSSGNALPEAQVISLEEAMTNGEAYESELVRVENLKPMSTNITVLPNEVFHLLTEDESQSGVLYAHAPANSEWANHGIHPLNTFNFEGILKEVDTGGGTEHVLAPHSESDIIPVEEQDFSYMLSDNSDFQDLSVGPVTEYGTWELTVSEKGAFEIVETDFEGGSKSAKLTLNSDFNVGTDWAAISPKESYELIPGAAYKVSAWIKTESGIGKAFVALGSDFPDGDGTNFDIYDTWNKYEIIAVAGSSGEGLTSFNFDLEENVSNTLYIDNIQVSGPVPDQPATIFPLTLVGGLIQDTVAYPVYLDPGSKSVEAFEWSLGFDPELVEVVIPEQTGTISEGFEVLTNFVSPGELVVSGAAHEGTTETGVLFLLQLVLKTGGQSTVDLYDMYVNEDWADSQTSELLIIERLCGDVTDDRSVSALDANFVLRHSVYLSPQFPLIELDSTAADVTANGFISAYDAAKILQYEVGLISELSCQTPFGKEIPQIAKASWNIGDENKSTVSIPVDFQPSDFDVYSVQFTIEVPTGVTLKEVEGLPENWQMFTNQKENKVHLSVFGVQPLTEKNLSLRFNRGNDKIGGNAALSGQMVLNESDRIELPKINMTSLPNEFKLAQNYPNPFNPSTNITYSLPEKSRVTLTVYNLLGQTVGELVNTNQEAGTYTVTWDAGSLSSGVYMYRLTTGGNSFTKRMMLIK